MWFIVWKHGKCVCAIITELLRDFGTIKEATPIECFFQPQTISFLRLRGYRHWLWSGTKECQLLVITHSRAEQKCYCLRIFCFWYFLVPRLHWLPRARSPPPCRRKFEMRIYFWPLVHSVFFMRIFWILPLSRSNLLQKPAPSCLSYARTTLDFHERGLDGAGRDVDEYTRASARTFRHILMNCTLLLTLTGASAKRRIDSGLREGGRDPDWT